MENKLEVMKLGSYPSTRGLHNFVADKELTVTITLGEYREIIGKSAISDYEIKKRDSKIWELEKKVWELEQKLPDSLAEQEKKK